MRLEPGKRAYFNSAKWKDCARRACGGDDSPAFGNPRFWARLGEFEEHPPAIDRSDFDISSRIPDDAPVFSVCDIDLTSHRLLTTGVSNIPTSNSEPVVSSFEVLEELGCRIETEEEEIPPDLIAISKEFGSGRKKMLPIRRKKSEIDSTADGTQRVRRSRYYRKPAERKL